MEHQAALARPTLTDLPDCSCTAVTDVRACTSHWPALNHKLHVDMAGAGLTEMSAAEVGFDMARPTLLAGNLLNDSRIVQVRAWSVTPWLVPLCCCC